MYLPTNRHFFSFFSFGAQMPAIQQDSKYRAKARRGAETTPLAPVQTSRHAAQHTAGQSNKRLPDFLPRDRADAPCKAARPDRPQEPRSAAAPHLAPSRRSALFPAPPELLAPHRNTPPRRIGTRRGTRQHGGTVRLHNEQDCARSGNEAAPEAAPGAATERRRQPHFPIRTPVTQ